jgi:hypothetical protein
MSVELPAGETGDGRCAVRGVRSTPHPVMICPSSSTLTDGRDAGSLPDQAAISATRYW